MEADGAGAPQFDSSGQEVNVGNGKYQELFFLDVDDHGWSTQKMLNVTGLNKQQATEMYNDFHRSVAGATDYLAQISAWTPPAPASVK